MATVRVETDINVAPQRVWDAIADVGAVHQRLLPGRVVDARIEGDTRILTMPDGSQVRELIISIDHSMRRMFAAASEPVQLQHFTLVVDYSGLAGVATVTAAGSGIGCTVAGAVLTCVSPFAVHLGTLTNLSPQLAIKPAAGAVVGVSGKWKATISADGVAPLSTEATVAVAEGVDLGVPTHSATLNSAPGATLPYPLEINNVGERTAAP